MATKQRKHIDLRKGITHSLDYSLVHNRPTNRLPTTTTHRNLLRSATQKGSKIMKITYRFTGLNWPTHKVKASWRKRIKRKKK
jgi:hypothetical protein